MELAQSSVETAVVGQVEAEHGNVGVAQVQGQIRDGHGLVPQVLPGDLQAGFLQQGGVTGGLSLQAFLQYPRLQVQCGRHPLDTALPGGQDLTHDVPDLVLEVVRVALLEPVHDPQRLLGVVEAPVLTHQLVEHVLAGVPERRMAEVVGQADGFHQLFV